MIEWASPFAMVATYAGSSVCFFFVLHVVFFMTKAGRIFHLFKRI